MTVFPWPSKVGMLGTATLSDRTVMSKDPSRATVHYLVTRKNDYVRNIYIYMLRTIFLHRYPIYLYANNRHEN